MSHKKITTFLTYSKKNKENVSVTNSMKTPTFWIEKYKNSKDVVLTLDKILRLNETITLNPEKFGVYNMEKYSQPSKEVIRGLIERYTISFSNLVGDNGLPFNADYETALNISLNLNNITSNGNVTYGLTVIKTNLRSYPTNDGAYTKGSNNDLFQQSSLEVNQPVTLLHTSTDGKWFFVQGYNYNGWCKADDIGFTTKEALFTYLNSNDFIMITGNHLKAENIISNTYVSFNMGAKLFLNSSNNGSDNVLVNLPARLPNGDLSFENGKVSISEDFHYGYLTYTVENVLKQAFKPLGDPYDWGNKYNSRDCSGFVGAVYNTFGFTLPRDTQPMDSTPASSIVFNSRTSDKERKNTILSLSPGSLIFLSGHVVMLLGADNGEPYIIHNHGLYKGTSGCEVTPASIFNYKSYISTLTLK